MLEDEICLLFICFVEVKRAHDGQFGIFLSVVLIRWPIDKKSTWLWPFLPAFARASDCSFSIGIDAKSNVKRLENSVVRLELFLFSRLAAKTFRPVSPLPTMRPVLHPNSSSENDFDDSESSGSLSSWPVVGRFSADGTTIPDGGVPLTPDQAAILTRLLYESNQDEEQLHHVLTSIANASTYRESKAKANERTNEGNRVSPRSNKLSERRLHHSTARNTSHYR